MKNHHLTFILFLTLTFTFTGLEAKTEMKLKSFETDGCTMFIDGTSSSPGLWRHCCVEHDLRYWFGGSVKDMDSADLRLKSCVQKVAGESWATVIYNGVRAGHHSPIKNKYHWGWAWSVKREKKPLSPEETTYVISELKQMTVEEVNIDEFIKVNFLLAK